KTFVHWWYYPASYDQWIPTSVVEGEMQPIEQKEKWRIHARFLRDSELFNEWMEEADYDLDVLEEDEKKSGGKVEESPKRIKVKQSDKMDIDTKPQELKAEDSR